MSYRGSSGPTRTTRPSWKPSGPNSGAAPLADFPATPSSMCSPMAIRAPASPRSTAGSRTSTSRPCPMPVAPPDPERQTMVFKIAGFEVRYQLRQPICWVGLILFVLLSFGSVASSNIQIGSTDNIHKNAAYVICQTTLIFAVLYMFVTTAIVANVITRDDETGFGSIVRSTPITQFDYLYRRYLGALIAAALGMLSIPAGLLLGSLAPWVDHVTLRPFTVAPYVYAYLALALPILLLTSALYFALTTVTRSMMWTYVGLVVLLVLRAEVM